MANPYEPPQTIADENTSSTALWRPTRYSVTPNCPFCETAVSRFSIWNSLGLKRCPECNAKLWLLLPPALRVILMPAAMLITPVVVVLIRSRATWVLAIGPIVFLFIVLAQLRWSHIAGVADDRSAAKDS